MTGVGARVLHAPLAQAQDWRTDGAPGAAEEDAEQPLLPSHGMRPALFLLADSACSAGAFGTWCIMIGSPSSADDQRYYYCHCTSGYRVGSLSR